MEARCCRIQHMASTPTAAQPLSRRQTAREHVAEYLRREILSGALEPGERLQVDVISSLLKVSHTPTREAFQQLEAGGLLVINAYRGAHVAELSALEYEEIFLMRVGLEGLAARTGAEAIDDAGVELMRTHLAEMRAAAKRGDVDEFLERDRAYHRVHYTASGRVRLWERIIDLRYAAERYTRLGYRLVDVGIPDVLASHTEILDAVSRRDGPVAETLITEDLKRTYDSVTRTLRETTES
jgi:GntR family transcriptional regulator, rspAB operon transcriptional repressor